MVVVAKPLVNTAAAVMLRDGIWHRRYGGDKEIFEAVCLSHGLVGFLTCCLTAYLASRGDPLSRL